MSAFFHYLGAFSLMLGILIVIHELGHYLVARLFGVRVLKFSMGFGPTLWARPMGRDRTEWSLGLIPLGGYVKFLDERDAEVAPEEWHRTFNRQTVWRRMGIVAAGPAANLLMAIAVYWGLFAYGTQELRPVLGAPVALSPAAKAGIERGEQVLKVGQQTVQTWQEMRWELLRQAANQEIVSLEVINSRREMAVRRLETSSLKHSGWQGDVLESLGLRFYRPFFPPVIGKISPGGVAQAAGLRTGDEVLAIDGETVDEWADVVVFVRRSPEKTLVFEIERNGSRQDVLVTPALVIENGKRIGRIGVAVREDGLPRENLVVTVRYGVLDALNKAMAETWDKSVFSLVMIGRMLVGEVSWRNISGPVTIADYAGKSAKSGMDTYLKFLALVSISLAVLNLLPIPILDGGHLLYYVIEIFRRQPLSDRIMEIGQQIGLAVLMMLMLFAFYNDFDRLISG